MKIEMTEHQIAKYFPALSEKKLREKLLESCSIHTFEKGTVLMEEGSYVRLLPLILDGKIKIVKEELEKEILLYYLTSGESCVMSMSACVQNEKSKVKAVTEATTEVILVPADLVNKWLRVYPSWNNFVIDSYRQRFENVLDAFNAVAFKKLDERLIDYLQQKAVDRKIKVTHQAIANDLGTARPVISRLLKELEHQGRIKLLRGTIELLKL